MEAGLEDYEQELFQGVEEWMESLRTKLREEKLKLKRERKEFEEEKEKMGALVGKIDEIVELNVGGTRFATTRSLLCQYRGTVLEAMFSGRWQLPTDAKGRIFIDRNPRMFERILEFLR